MASDPQELPKYADKLDLSLPAFGYNEKYKETLCPNPGWKAGDGANNLEIMSGEENITASDTQEAWQKYKKLGFDPHDNNDTPSNNYKFVTSAIAPRPVALISSQSAFGTNLAPFSYFQVVSNTPLVFALGISKGRNHVKDTARNLQETRECTFNLVSEWMVEAANYTCANAPAKVSEWKLAGLTPVAGTVVKCPHVLESPVSVECKVIHDIPMLHPTEKGRETGNVFLLEAVYVHVREDVLQNGKQGGLGSVLLDKIKPVCRLEGITYGRVHKTFDMPKIDMSQEQAKPENKKLFDSL